MISTRNETRVLVLGFLMGLTIALLLLRRSTITEVVRDSEGRIVQIVTMSDITPIFGNKIYTNRIIEPIEVDLTKKKRLEKTPGIIP